MFYRYSRETVRASLFSCCRSIAILACFAPGFSAAQTFNEFTPPTAGQPLLITVGPDGNLWYSGGSGNKISKLTTSGTFTEYFPPTANSQPFGITPGPDGNLWLTESGNGKIAKVTTAGVFTEYSPPTAGSGPTTIVWGPDNLMWFTELSSNKIGKSTLTGTITEFTVPTAGSGPNGMAVGADGNLWFTEFLAAGNKIGRITPGSGTITEFVIPTGSAISQGDVLGPDGAVWFAESVGNKIGRITTAGVITEFSLPNSGSGARRLVVGLDGAVWFTESAGRLGRITTAGAITEFTTPTVGGSPFGITVGPDGALWFTEANVNKIGRFVPALPSGPTPLVASVLPTSRSVQVGNFATVFATILNTTSTPQTGCRITTDTFVPGFFSYQTTNPATNALFGSPNTSANISASGLQTYVLAFKAGAPMPPADVKFMYLCDNVLGATPIVGVNTLALTFDNNPVADMIAVGVTPSNDGFSHTGGNSGTGVFAVATTNIGPATVLTARARLSDSSLPLTVTLCETNASAVCNAPPAATVSRSFGNNEASTFSAFLKASGAITPDPATKRVFLEFLDGGGVLRGSTSTAVTTQ